MSNHPTGTLPWHFWLREKRESSKPAAAGEANQPPPVGFDDCSGLMAPIAVDRQTNGTAM